jgi:putative membrane protein
MAGKSNLSNNMIRTKNDRLWLSCAVTILSLFLATLTCFAGELSSQDESFLAAAAKSGMAEIELSKLAGEKSSRSDIKMYAHQLLSDHTKATEELKTLAVTKKYKLPTGPGVANDTKKVALQALEGRDFEDKYVNSMVDDHKSALKLFQEESQNGVDPDIKKFASKTLPILREHLSMAKALEGKMVTPTQ